MSLGTKQHGERTARLGGELQTPQPAIVGALQPKQNGGANTGTQCLLSRPQSLRGRSRTNHQQTLKLDTRCAKAGA